MRHWLALCAAIYLIAINHAVWPLRAAAQCDCGTVCTCPECPIEHKGKQGRWAVVETADFQICHDQSEAQATQLAYHAESWRSRLCAAWLGDGSPDRWNPKCQVVLHSSQSSYVAAVGRGSERTVGSSLVKIDKGQIVSRRIDLLGAGTNILSAALPHELTHVVLRDRFTSTVVPRWADEGMATLADTKAKQERHDRDLKESFDHGTTFRAAELLTADEYPAPSRFGAFYGESVSLTRFFVARKSPEQFVNFLERARATGCDAALRECYGIAGAGDLDRQWRQHVSELRPATFEETIQFASDSAQPEQSSVATTFPSDQSPGK
jgi:hypothetical protein